MIRNEYDAYDVCINDQNERFIVIYKVTLESEDADYYVKRSVNCFESNNLKEDIKKLRSEGYYSISEFGFLHDPIDSNNILATMYFTFKGNRVVTLEKIYYQEIINDMTYIMGCVNFVDLITGNEYIVRTNNFGIQSDETIRFAESLGYIHISDYNLKNDFNKLNDYFIHKLVPKKK
ncbi:MAG: hypothetical protein E7163_02645 [Firmicutes bacterium]|nr:hypothetical protein [Bacillota bacterium]